MKFIQNRAQILQTPCTSSGIRYSGLEGYNKLQYETPPFKTEAYHLHSYIFNSKTVYYNA